MKNKPLLFVYGTLRSGGKCPEAVRDALKRYTTSAGLGRVPGRLYRISFYPGFVKPREEGEWVCGEFLRVLNEELLFELLDRYEGCSADDPQPFEYERILLDLFPEEEAPTKAWIYHYLGDTEGKEWIRSGDFFDPESAAKHHSGDGSFSSPYRNPSHEQYKSMT